MDLTGHGNGRIFDRTLLKPKDVLYILEAKAFVPIGIDKKNDNELVLFYSPFDNNCKIAVLSPDNSALVSVLKAGYLLPEGIEIVTRALKMQAKQKYREWLFGKMKETSQANQVNVTLLVRKSSKIIDMHECGTVPALFSNQIDSAVRYLAQVLQAITATTAALYGHNTIRYELQMETADGEVRKHHFRHPTLVGKIRASSR